MHRSSPILPALIACILWSTAFVAIKIGLPYYAPLQFAGLRFILSGILILPFCFASYRRWGILLKHIPLLLVISLLQTILLYASFFYGMTLVKGAQAAIIIGASPLASAIAAHIAMKHDKMTRRSIGFISLGFSGIIILSLGSKPWTHTGLQEVGGMLLLLGGVITSAIGNVIIAQRATQVPVIPMNALQIFFGGVVLYIWGMLQEGVQPLPQAPQFWYSLIWLATISAVSFTIWFTLLQKNKVSELNLWKFVIPVSGAILSWILLPNESPSLITIAGIVLVGSGVLGYYVPPFKKGSSPSHT